MAQMKTYSFTCAASPANVDIDVGFDVAHAEFFNFTDQDSSANPGVVKRAYYVDSMADGSAVVVKNTAGAATDASDQITSGGFTMGTSAGYGSAISAFTNANPGVITVSNASAAGFAAGDTITVSQVADDNSGTSLNGTYTIASVSGNNITTATNTTAYSVWVSGGIVMRVSDTNGNPVPVQNIAQRYLRIGTTLQTASAVCHVTMWGKENVV
jgi:hypothetical protein